jgi:hypothetical protein
MRLVGMLSMKGAIGWNTLKNTKPALAVIQENYWLIKSTAPVPIEHGSRRKALCL